MGSIQNTRILRFLIVLAMVILTIFIYASYSTIATLAPSPPHMRTAGPAIAAALHSSTTAAAASNKTSNIDSVADKFDLTGRGHIYSHSKQLQKQQQQQPQLHSIAASVLHSVAPAKRHRIPTIDADAGGGDGNALLDNDVPDEAALARFVNNDLLEDQYVQNVENTLGNINISAPSIDALDLYRKQQPQTQKQQQQSEQTQQVGQQPQQQQQQQQLLLQQQQQQQSQLVDNNLNKILDSEVLIPTSNLQKFIENADKILKNITVVPPVDVAPVVADAVASKELISPDAAGVQQKQSNPQTVPQQQPQNVDAVAKPDNVAVNLDEDDDAQPPSVVMTIKRGGGAAAAAAKSLPNTTKGNAINKSPIAKAAVTSNSNNNNNSNNTTKPNNRIVDPTQGIPTQQIYESGHMNEELNLDKLCPNQGTDLKLIILITSAQTHADARLAIRQTWAHYGIRRDVSTAFVLGRTTNETLNLALTQENFIYGDLIRGHFIDSYNNLTLKTVSALEWVDKHCARAKYVLKTDDDMFINVPKLLAFLDSRSKEKRVIYGRLANKWKPIRNKKSKYYVSLGQFSAPVFPPFTTGPAYVMTSDIVHELHIRSLHQVYLKLEDVFTTGIVAQQLGIKRVHVNEFLNRRIAFNPCNIRKTISVHMIKANEQFDLWKKLLDQTTKCK